MLGVTARPLTLTLSPVPGERGFPPWGAIGLRLRSLASLFSRRSFDFKDQLTNGDLVSHFDSQLGDTTSNRRGHLDGRLLSFQLEHWLVDRDRVADRHEDLHDVARPDVLAELRKLELCHGAASLEVQRVQEVQRFRWFSRFEGFGRTC